MVSEVIMLENEHLIIKEVQKIIKKFVTNNSFLNVVVDDSRQLQVNNCQIVMRISVRY